MGVETASARMTSEQIVAANRAHTFFSWSIQGQLDPIAIDRALGLGRLPNARLAQVPFIEAAGRQHTALAAPPRPAVGRGGLDRFDTCIDS